MTGNCKSTALWHSVQDRVEPFHNGHLGDRRKWLLQRGGHCREVLKQESMCGLACENIRFSSLFAAGDVACGGTSATQRQKFHTDDANQCLHNKSGSHGVPNINLSNFTCLLVDFGKVWCSSANELQQNSNASSREDYIPQILTVLLEILRVYLWPLWPFVFCLSFVNYSVDQSALLTRFRTDFMSSVWNFCRWVTEVTFINGTS